VQKPVKAPAARTHLWFVHCSLRLHGDPLWPSEQEREPSALLTHAAPQSASLKQEPPSCFGSQRPEKTQGGIEGGSGIGTPFEATRPVTPVVPASRGT
jgi:hypothetical protein